MITTSSSDEEEEEYHRLGPRSSVHVERPISSLKKKRKSNNRVLRIVRLVSGLRRFMVWERWSGKKGARKAAGLYNDEVARMGRW